MATPYDICLVTVGDEKTAAAITDGLLNAKLAACVSTVPGLSSSYRWKGRIEQAKELLLIIKTRRILREDIIQAVRRRHTNKVPEILFFEVAKGSKDYLDWLGASTLFTANISKDKPEDKGL